VLKEVDDALFVQFAGLVGKDLVEHDDLPYRVKPVRRAEDQVAVTFQSVSQML
jgi:hypothetical protein